MERKEPKLTDEELVKLADEAVESYKSIQLKSDDELKSPEMQRILEEGRKYLEAAEDIQNTSKNKMEHQKLVLLAIKNGSNAAFVWLSDGRYANKDDPTFRNIAFKCLHAGSVYSKSEETRSVCKDRIFNRFCSIIGSANFEEIKQSGKAYLLPIVYYAAVAQAPGEQFNVDRISSIWPPENRNLRHLLSEFAMQMPEQFDALLDKDSFEKVWPSFKSIFQVYNDKVDDHVATEVLRRYKQRHIEQPVGEMVQMHQTIPGGSPTELDEIYASLLSRDEKASDVKEIVTEVHRQLASTSDTAKALESSQQDLIKAIATKNNEAILTAMSSWLQLIRNHLELRIEATAPKYGSASVTSTTSTDARSKIIGYKKEIEDVLSNLEEKIKPKLESSKTFINDILERIAIVESRCPAEEKLIKQQAALLTKNIEDQYPQIAKAGKKS